MKVVSHEVKGIGKGTTCTLWGIYDTHLGNVETQEDVLRETVKEIADDPWALAFGGGDYGEHINIDDRRFDPDTVAPWVPMSGLKDMSRLQMDRLVDILKPIKNKMIGFLHGNHDLKILNRYFFNPVAYLADKLGVPDWNDTQVWLRLSYVRGGSNRHQYHGLLAHGWGGGRLAGGPALNLERVLRDNTADFIFFGHTHRHDYQEVTQRSCDDGGNLVYHTRIALNPGSILPRPKYAERAGYAPQRAGYSHVEIVPNHHKLRAIGAWVNG
jgi:hypothetical protein